MNNENMHEEANKKAIVAKVLSSKLQNRHLESSILLRETSSSIFIKRSIIGFGIILLAFIIWSNLLKLDELALTKGEIIHQGSSVKIQHLIGGRVKAVLVKNGSFVKKGQVLIKLDPVISALEMESVEEQQQSLEAKAIRLKALISGDAPDFSSIKDLQLRLREDNIYEKSKQSIALEKEMVKSQISQVRKEIVILKSNYKKLGKSTSLIKEELNIRKNLNKKGLNARVTLINLEKDYSNSSYELKEIPISIEKLKEKIVELEASLNNVESKEVVSYAMQLTDTYSKLKEVNARLSIFDNNIDELDIKSPVDGYVHDLRLRSQGEVAKAGDIIVTLIPTDKPLIAKVKIQAKDIGHIKIGDPANLRITTYDSRRYGTLKGTVMSISPSAFVPDDKTSPYYEGIISINSDNIGLTSGKMALFSGMTLTADIKTGEKTLFEYLLKPIYVTKKLAFYEK